MTDTEIKQQVWAAINTFEQGNRQAAVSLLFPLVASEAGNEARVILGSKRYSALVETYLYIMDGDLTPSGRKGGFESLDACKAMLLELGLSDGS